MMTRKNIVIIFTRYPLPGHSKTRLIPAIGPEKAAMVQRQMTEATMARVKELAAAMAVEIKVFHEGGTGRHMEEWLGPFVYQQQQAGDLGHKMGSAFGQSFRDNGGKVMIIGTDCPGLRATILREGFKLLDRHDLVLGPATDGGYYLIGLRRLAPLLFADIPWGTGLVLETTRRRALESGMTVSYLPELPDVDRPQDLHLLSGGNFL